MSKLLIALALCAATTGSAFAQTTSHDPDEVQYKVGFADLNLATAAGAATFDRRIAGAVDKICGRSDLRDFAATWAVKACRADAFSRVADARSAVIAAAQDAKTTQVAALDVR